MLTVLIWCKAGSRSLDPAILRLQQTDVFLYLTFPLFSFCLCTAAQQGNIWAITRQSDTKKTLKDIHLICVIYTARISYKPRYVHKSHFFT